MNEIDIREREDLDNALLNADIILSKSYLSMLNNKEISTILHSDIDFTKEDYKTDFNSKFRFYEISKIIFDKNENNQEKLISIFNAIWNSKSPLFVLIQGKEDSVSFKIGTNADSSNLLKNSFQGNFPGTELGEKPIKGKDIDKVYLFKTDDSQKYSFVSSVSIVPTKRSKEENKEHKFIQGIEKVIDALQGKKYSLLLIADPVSNTDLDISRKSLENLYSQLVPFSESQLTIGENELASTSKALSKGTSDSISQSLADSISHTYGENTSHTKGKNVGMNLGVNGGINKGQNFGSNTTENKGWNYGIAIIGRSVGKAIGTFAGQSIGGFLGGSVGLSAGMSWSDTKGSSYSDTNGSTSTHGTTQTFNENETHTTSESKGRNKNLQIKFENHSVKKLMEKIDKTLKRYDNCKDYGMWNTAVYCIAASKNVSSMVASIYQSVMRGEDSSLENGSVVSWDKEQSSLVLNSLRQMQHPRIKIGGNTYFTPGTLISSAELAISAGLPYHSVPGISVLECADFGRTISSYDNIDSGERNQKINIGNIFHMHQTEKLPVTLNTKSLCSHTFITGSTGSGKSNTVYQLLNEIKRCGQKFLVVEPAKGEYKNVFGKQNDVCVYGTNPALTQLLRINPFSFPNGNEDASKNIHILEHLDRLIEIFNVCWPMYAAMPAVLKEAVEKSYEDCGWNLTESTNEYGNNLYPTFADITRNIRTIIDNSEYDKENKGAYKGALITRLKSLSNGINGLVFTTDEIKNEDLFDKNVIVDLSRVGSAETKSLIMGLLVLKLQEYRITSGEMNSDLKHITVLEEAHNLLKRTSTEQSQDSGNLLGKSVEMLTNSIAEMRTYGEGFIIADQAPGLLDMAVIRNTNTKIIMRLPDQDDRELVGKAANLNDDQIKELAKLPCGVAAVYQNEWVEPVLCQINKYEYTDEKYIQKDTAVNVQNVNSAKNLEIAKLLCNGTKLSTTKEITDLMDNINIPCSTKVRIYKFLQNPPTSPRYTKLAPLVSELLPEIKTELKAVFEKNSNPEVWTDIIDTNIRNIENNIEQEVLREIRQCIITELLYNELGNHDAYNEWRNKGVK